MSAGEALRIEALDSGHDRSGFESGVEPLDRYLRVQAGQEARKNLAATFVLSLPDGGVAGDYTLSSTALKPAELPEATSRKLPRYPLVPSTLLGRLAVSLTHRGKGYGRFLLADALYRACGTKSPVSRSSWTPRMRTLDGSTCGKASCLFRTSP